MVRFLILSCILTSATQLSAIEPDDRVANELDEIKRQTSELTQRVTAIESIATAATGTEIDYDRLRLEHSGFKSRKLFLRSPQPSASQSSLRMQIPCRVKEVHGYPISAKPGQELPCMPDVPGGYLSERIGTWHVIEGVRYEGPGADEANTLVVDTVDGCKLETPIPISVRNLRLPKKARCTLQGYESGGMVGVPPAEYKYVETTEQLVTLQR